MTLPSMASPINCKSLTDGGAVKREKAYWFSNHFSDNQNISKQPNSKGIKIKMEAWRQE